MMPNSKAAQPVGRLRGNSHPVGPPAMRRDRLVEDPINCHKTLQILGLYNESYLSTTNPLRCRIQSRSGSDFGAHGVSSWGAILKPSGREGVSCG